MGSGSSGRALVRTALVCAALAAAGSGMAADAQSVPLPKLVIYGNQKCPTDANGEEIVVCERRSQAEQFRIPKELREFKVTPANESWASKVVANDKVAADGIGSCTTVGPGGATGCFLQQAQAARAAKNEQKADEAHVQAALP